MSDTKPPARKKRRKPAAQRLEERLELRITSAEKTAFQSAAEQQGIALSLWLRLAARTIVKDHKGKVELVVLD